MVVLQEAEGRIFRNALVLEDDPWVMPVIEIALRDAVPQIQIDHVESVNDAIERIKTKHYEVIVADIFVKGSQNGVAFWDYCHENCPETEILLTSSMSVDVFQEQFAQSRSNPLYLAKPFDIGELSRAVHGLLDFTGVSS